jgi:hypothetical protein
VSNADGGAGHSDYGYVTNDVIRIVNFASLSRRKNAGKFFSQSFSQVSTFVTSKVIGNI